jgi:dipeptidyl aminopeptidase/acylaminoacyl peptidase
VKLLRWIALLAVALAFSSPVISSPARAASLSAYGKLPAIEDVDISPNGKLLAMIRTDGEKRRVEILDLDARKFIGGIDAGNTKVRSVQWADDTHVLITISQTSLIPDVIASRNDWSMAIIYDINARTQRPLLGKRETESLNIILDQPVVRIVDGRPVVYVMGVTFVEGYGTNAIFRTDLATARTTVDVVGSPDTEDFLVGDDGKVAAELQYNPKRGITVLRLRDGKALRNAPLPADASRMSLAGFSADGKSVLVYYWPKGKGKERVLAEASLETGDWRPVAGSDNQAAMFDPRTSRIIGLHSLKDDVSTYTYYDPRNQQVWNAIVKAYSGDRVSPAGASADRKRIVAFVDSPTEGETYSLVDLATGDASIVGVLYPEIKPADISLVKPISYKAADGKVITGYLTLPRGKGDKNLPLIVLPHGGPASRDTLGFDWWAQALANRGYAVLQPNFRGSTGFGREFLESGYGEFGRKMQTDLSDGVRYFAAEGTIDPKRVCIVGGSYGGYAALAGAAIDTGVYRCAASIAGPADLRRMLADERNDSGLEAFQYWTEFMGVEGTRDPDLAAISPASHADAVKIPLLLVHGKDDTVVLYEQSKIMADAMKKAGKPVEFVTLDGEDHHLSRGVTRLKMLEAVTAFVEKNNPPG